MTHFNAPSEDDESYAGESTDNFIPSHVLSFKVQRGRERCFFQEISSKVLCMWFLTDSLLEPKDYAVLPVKLKGAWFIRWPD